MKRQLSESEIRREVERVARVRVEHPAPPAGVRMFDPRKVARHRRKVATHQYIRELSSQLGQANVSRKALGNLLQRKSDELSQALGWRSALRTLWRKAWPWAR